MSDLIRREDAIEAVRKELVCDGRHEAHDKTCRFIADVLLSALPSAKGGDAEVNETKSPYMQQSPNNGADLISRQDAIDAVMAEGRNVDTSECANAERIIYEADAVEALSMLPSADRPTGECRTCGRNADNGGVHEDGRTKCPIQEHYALLLDGYCHLYEPYDCGAKMKGADDED